MKHTRKFQKAVEEEFVRRKEILGLELQKLAAECGAEIVQKLSGHANRSARLEGLGRWRVSADVEINGSYGTTRWETR